MPTVSGNHHLCRAPKTRRLQMIIKTKVLVKIADLLVLQECKEGTKTFICCFFSFPDKRDY